MTKLYWLDIWEAVLATIALILYSIRFVPWNEAFNYGFFDSPQYIKEQVKLINQNPVEYNVYRATMYIYLATVMFEISKNALPSTHPVNAGFKALTEPLELLLTT